MKISDPQFRRTIVDTTPEESKVRVSRLSRVTDLEVIDSKDSDSALSMSEEMERAWEKDWANL